MIFDDLASHGSEAALTFSSVLERCAMSSMHTDDGPVPPWRMHLVFNRHAGVYAIEVDGWVAWVIESNTYQAEDGSINMEIRAWRATEGLQWPG